MRRTLALAVALIAFVMMLSVFSSLGKAEGTVVWTDKQDYAPNEVVTIFGSGFDPSAPGISVEVMRPDGTAFPPVYGMTRDPLDLGRFVCYYDLNGIMGTYTVTASDGINSPAVCYFTDTQVSFVQGENNQNPTDSAVDSTIFWKDGELNGANSLITEGNVPPPYPSGIPGHVNYRLILMGYSPGTYVLTIEYQFTKNGKVAFDFLTTNYGIPDSWLKEERLPSGVTLAEMNTLILAGPTTQQLELDTVTIVRDDTVSARQIAHDAIFTSAGYSPRLMKVWGATILDTSVPTYSGDVTDTSLAFVTVAFRKESGTDTAPMMLSWGGHLGIGAAAPIGYGVGYGAGSISGSPFHMALDSLTLNGGDTHMGKQSQGVATSAIAPGEISGVKFDDLNGNGVKDTGEPGLPDWTIALTGQTTWSTKTDANGYYQFVGLPEGTYYLSEVPQSGWVQTMPSSGTYTVVIAGQNQVFSNRDFGNFELVTITADKWDDSNGDGVWDTDEYAFTGWLLTLSGPADGIYSGSATQGAPATWVVKKGGSWSVSEESRSGWIPTTSSPVVLSGVESGDSPYTVTFGNVQQNSVIKGCKFNDLNGNGAKDVGEPGLNGWTITLSGATSGTTTTAADGSYEFTGLGLGNYVVGEVLQDGWTQTTPTPSGTYSVSIVSSGQIADGRDFGNFQWAHVKVTKMDTSGNYLAGWDISLSGVTQTTAGLDGSTTFVVKQAGSYTVSEAPQPGWSFYSVTPAATTFTVQSGGNYEYTFVNFQNVDITVYKKDTSGNYLDGWTIKLYGPNPPANDQTGTTSGGGKVVFTVAKPGDYTLSEVTQPGWTLISPSGNLIPVTGVVSGGSYGPYTFTNFEDVVITVHKKDTKNSPLEGWTINLAGPNGQSGSDDTDANGVATFTVHEPGDYSFTEVLEPGWTQTLPVGGTLYVDDVVTGVDRDAGYFVNFQNVAIKGMKFNDKNSNGVFDGLDSGLGGWTIKITYPDGVTTNTRTTGSDGKYEFLGLGPGTYRVEEIGQGGWIQTAPGGLGYYSVATVTGQDATAKDFGNFQQVTITADKWNDLDGDGAKDDGEPEITGWEYLTLKYPDGTVSQMMSPASWTVSAAGTYVLSEIPHDGWTRTTSDVTLEISSGGSVSTVWFGNFQNVAITADKFRDMNGNGQMDGSDARMDWTLSLYRKSSLVDVLIGTVATNGAAASWTVHQGGDYYVTEADKPGWTHTTDATVYLNGVQSGDSPAKIWFGNFENVDIKVTKYVDKYGDGTILTAKSGWKVYLNGGSEGATGADGSHTWTDLGPGDYVVTEENPTGWTPIGATSHSFLDVQSGHAMYTCSFSNWEWASICGMKVTDKNGNGVIDNDEWAGMNGWTIYIYQWNEQTDHWDYYKHMDTRTYAAGELSHESGEIIGRYCFMIEEPGIYQIREILKPGWTMTFPLLNVGDELVTKEVVAYEVLELTESGCWYRGYHIANWDWASICGRKFIDIDGDGDWEDEPASSFVNGWWVSLYKWVPKVGGLPGEGSWQFVEKMQTKTYGPGDPPGTSGTITGRYCFWIREPGTYEVRELLPSGWTMTYPAEHVGADAEAVAHTDLPLTASGGEYRAYHIGNWQWATVKVIKKDTSGNCLAGWDITLNGVTQPTAGAEGSTTFSVKTPGQYTVSETLKDGWTFISVTPAATTFNVASGGSYTFTFVNFEWATVTAYKEDTEGDPVEGWQMSVGGQTDDTDAEGKASFTLKQPGAYTLSEEDQDGWTHMDATTWDFAAESGGSYSHTFVNFKNVDITVYKRDTSENLQDGWTIKLAGPDPKTGSTGTNGDGCVIFTVTKPGDYSLSENKQNGWTLIDPVDNLIAVDDVESGVNRGPYYFTNFDNVVVKVKKTDTSGLALSGWTMYMQGPGMAGPTAPALTDGSGIATFTVTAPGLYTFTEKLESGWTMVSPAEGMFTATVASGDADFLVGTFQNFKWMTISGHKYVYDDSYCTGFNDLSGWTTYSGTWALEGGELSGTSIGSEAWIWNNNLYSGDTTIEWRMQFITTPSDNVGKHGGIMSFSTTQTGRYSSSGYTIDWIDRTVAPYDHGFRIYKWTGGTPTLLGLVGSSFNLLEDQWYDWKVVMVDGDISLYVDGVLTGTVHDTTYSSGYLGFWLYSNKEHAHFDDLCVHSESVSVPQVGWTMNLYREGASGGTTATDGLGYYSFTVKHPGSYSISEMLKAGWTALKPVNQVGSDVDTEVVGYTGIVVKSGVNVGPKDFWNFKWATVKVEKHDYSSGAGLLGWHIDLAGQDAQDGDTGVDGGVTFTVKQPGLYTATEVEQDGYTRTSAASFSTVVESGGSYYLGPFVNFKWLTISGHKYISGTTTPLPGWHMQLFKGSVQYGSDAVTDINGYYSFLVKDPGAYDIMEVLQDRWTETYPVLKHSPDDDSTPSVLGYSGITMVSGVDVPGKDFYNFQWMTICGVKVRDYNGDGIWNDGDTGMNEWVIKLYKNGIEVDSTETRTYLKGDPLNPFNEDIVGRYCFVITEPGTYEIKEVLQAGWTKTSPGYQVGPESGSVVVDTGWTETVQSGTNIIMKHFCNFQWLTICGRKFVDVDGDGVRETDVDKDGVKDPEDVDQWYEVEPGWTINIYKFNKQTEKWDLFDSMQTRTYGPPESEDTITARYCFLIKDPGRYQIREALPAGWTMTFPSLQVGYEYGDTEGTGYTYDVSSGGNIYERYFGNFKWPTITVYKRDYSSNLPLSGWDLSIDGAYNEDDQTLTTGVDGKVVFTVKHGGDYDISESLPATGWTLMSPAGNLIEVNGVRSGVCYPEAGELTFKNFQWATITVYKQDTEGDPLVWDINLAGPDPQSGTTDATYGKVVFTVHQPGDYDISEVLAAMGWTLVSPEDNNFDVAVASGDSYGGSGEYTFVNFEWMTISGYKCEEYFCDYFSDEAWTAANWKIIGTGTWDVDSGVYTGIGGSVPWGRDVSLAGAAMSPVMQRDFTLDVRVRNDHFATSVSPNQAACVPVRYDPSKDTMALVVFMTDKIQFQIADGGNWVILGTAAYTDIYGWHDLRIVAQGDNYWIYLDDMSSPKIVATYDDSNLGTKMGLWSYWGGGIATFDDFCVGTPLKDWTMNLYDSAGKVYATDVTDTNGYYEFLVKNPGTYSVAEALKTGWTAMCPVFEVGPDAGTHDVTGYSGIMVKSGVDLTGLDFCNFEWATITVTKHDTSGNLRDGWNVAIDGPGTADDQNGVTGDDGIGSGAVTFTIKNGGGAFVVSETLKGGWTFISSSANPVVVTSGGSYTFDFVNFQWATVTATKVDTEGHAVPGWEMSVGGQKGDTGVGGSVSFTLKEPGAYILSEEDQEGWTHMDSTTWAFNAASGGIYSYTFVNFQWATITVYKQDTEGDPLDWGINLIGPTAADNQEGATGDDGMIVFTVKHPGDYDITEDVAASGWTLISPTGNLFEVHAESGGSYGDGVPQADKFVFVNFEWATITAYKADSEGAPLVWDMDLDGPDAQTGTTDATYGKVVFTVKQPGDYDISEVLALTGWTLLSPEDNLFQVHVESGGSYGDLGEFTFVNFKWVTLSGMKYFDANGNGAKNEGEPGLANWVISIKNGETKYLTDATTASDGSYSFQVEDPGSYVLSETMLNSWWIQTAPTSPGTHSVTVESGVDVPDLDFGNWLGSQVFVTDTGFCVFDVDSATDGRQFKLIFTPDMPTYPQNYRLTASNPGQFYVNVFLVGYVGVGEEIVITLPYPFVTQGAVPVHVYDSLNTGPYGCLVPTGDISWKFGISPATVVLSTPNYDQFGETQTITLTANEACNGFVYVTVHVDYGLKKNIGRLSPDLNKNAVDGTNSLVIKIAQGYPYLFSASGPGGFSAEDTVYNTNVFKRNPGFGGLVLDKDGYPVKGVRAQVHRGTTFIGAAYADEDGWYMINYKHTGKSVTYVVKLDVTIGGTLYSLSATVTVKANSFSLVSWNLEVAVPMTESASTASLPGSAGGLSLGEIVGVTVLALSLIAAAGLARTPPQRGNAGVRTTSGPRTRNLR